jgi:hypothetical protein
LRHLIVLGMLAGFTPVVMPLVTIDKAEAAQASTQKKKQTSTQKKKKKPSAKQQPVVKKNYRAPLPGEPNAGWTDDCLFHYDVYGRLPFYCDANGRGVGRW